MSDYDNQSDMVTGQECEMRKFHKKDLHLKVRNKNWRVYNERKCELVRWPKKIIWCEMYESHIGYACHSCTM